jgi:hypothetical protein
MGIMPTRTGGIEARRGPLTLLPSACIPPGMIPLDMIELQVNEPLDVRRCRFNVLAHERWPIRSDAVDCAKVIVTQRAIVKMLLKARPIRHRCCRAPPGHAPHSHQIPRSTF